MRRQPTQAERALWTQLGDGRIAGAKFRRQQPIGAYIGDFVCQAARLVVEVDGSQHIDSDYDLQRDAFLAALGYCVLRFWNNDALANIGGVKEAIYAAVTCPHPPTAAQWVPPSPLKGEGSGDDLA